MSEELTTISVLILDKEYQVSCPVSEVDELTASAHYLHQKMAEIRESGKVLGSDRIAVMAALNIANDLLNNRSSMDEFKVLDENVVKLTERVSQVLDAEKS